MSDLELSQLDLAELERLEKKTLSGCVGFTPGLLHLTVQELDTVGRQLRPLLNLVERMGEKLEDAATALHAERAHEGRFWDCQRFGCYSANVTIKSYRRAKGEL